MEDRAKGNTVESTKSVVELYDGLANTVHAITDKDP
jgi:hypothetical protein